MNSTVCAGHFADRGDLVALHDRGKCVSRAHPRQPLHRRLGRRARASASVPGCRRPRAPRRTPTRSPVRPSRPGDSPATEAPPRVCAPGHRQVKSRRQFAGAVGRQRRRGLSCDGPWRTQRMPSVRTAGARSLSGMLSGMSRRAKNICSITWPRESHSWVFSGIAVFSSSHRR